MGAGKPNNGCLYPREVENLVIFQFKETDSLRLWEISAIPIRIECLPLHPPKTYSWRVRCIKLYWRMEGLESDVCRWWPATTADAFLWENGACRCWLSSPPLWFYSGSCLWDGAPYQGEPFFIGSPWKCPLRHTQKCALAIPSVSLSPAKLTEDQKYFAFRFWEIYIYNKILA